MVGSTVRTLRERTVGYRNRHDWFSDETHELVSLRVVEHDDPDFFPIYLKAVENLEIGRNEAWREDGGRNLMSPLVQWLNHPLEFNIASLGGRATSSISGQMSKAGKIGGRIGGKIGGKINGQLSVDNGRLESMRTREHQSQAGRRRMELRGNPATKESCSNGGKASSHKQWHIGRGIVVPTCSLCAVSND